MSETSVRVSPLGRLGVHAALGLGSANVTAFALGAEHTDALRHALAKDMVNRVFGQPAGAVHLWLQERAPGAEEHLVDRVIDFLCGAFEAPQTG